MVQSSLNKALALVHIQLGFTCAMLAIRPSQTAVYNKAHVSRKNCLLPWAMCCNALQHHDLLYGKRVLLLRRNWHKTQCHATHSCRGNQNVHFCTKKSLGKPQGFQKPLTFRGRSMHPPKLAQVFINSFLCHWENATCEPSPVARFHLPKDNKEDARDFKSWCRLVCKSICNNLPNVFIIPSQFNAFHQRPTQVCVHSAIQYDHLPTLKS